ncbi:MAG: hypothetical protein A2Y77_08875 [Planctomycetes bacterium RBG_13_62_9]|nr:MAG: hypothetical protein A2Y77_08875 [Planctomycetes bacterium RBG_13_62_9]
MEVVKEMTESASLRGAQAYRAMQFFRSTTRTEEAFLIRFERATPRVMAALRAWWPEEDEWGIFRRVCRFWGVGYRRRLGGGIPLGARRCPR